jgi:hypothetical protein
MKEDRYRDKHFQDVQGDIQKRWQALSEEQRATYEARSEELRNQAWDEINELGARLARRESTVGVEQPKFPGYDEFIERQNQEPAARAARLRPKRAPPVPEIARDAPGIDGKKQWLLHVKTGMPGPIRLFLEAQEALHPGQKLAEVWGVDDLPRELLRRFDTLREEERAPYETRSEELRQKACDEWDKVE